MVSMAVIAFGILGIIYLQGELASQSSENKARAEAAAYAEARIEDIRNYSDENITSYDEMIVDHLPSFEETEEPYNGINATFTRETQITDDTNIRVIVTWEDRSGNSRNVELNTSIEWFDPKSPTYSLENTSTAAYEPPTGIALLGEGKISQLGDELDPPLKLVQNQDDNIGYYEFDGSLYLADGDDIVLTLDNICNEGSFDNCEANVVTINGRVYIDNNTIGPSIVDSIAVKSSDVTYCTKFNPGETSPKKNYTTFDYRCYASYGWYGNIGIVFRNGFDKKTRICQGDPTLNETDKPITLTDPDEWEQVVLSPRRVYRGMYYKITDATTSGKVEVNGIPLYNSAGVNAGEELGLDVAGNPQHNFVVAFNTKDATSPDPETYCLDTVVMFRDDSNIDLDGDGTPDGNGSLFAGNEDDFYCLNPHLDVAELAKAGYSVDPTCPYDPSDPPVKYYVLTGSLGIPVDSGVSIVTSQSPELCTTTDSTYQCYVYDWGDGWSGYLQVNNPSLDTIVCNYDRVFIDVPSETASGTPITVSNGDLSCIPAAGGSFAVRGFIDDSTLVNTLDLVQEIEETSVDGTVVYTYNPAGYCYLDQTNTSYSCVTYDLGTVTGILRLKLESDNTVCETMADRENGVVDISDFISGSIYSKNINIVNNGQCP
jgi:hypothetical protein